MLELTPYSHWPELMGAMSQSDRERLAYAYETGDGKTVGEVLGAQLANLPIGGGGLGTIRKIDTLIEAAEKSSELNKLAANGARGANNVTSSVRVGGTVELFTDSSGPKVPGAVGVGPKDPNAVAYDARNMPNIPSNSQATVIVNNPFIDPKDGGTMSMMDYLPEAARITQSEGKIVINANGANKYFNTVPTAAQLEALGLKIEYQGRLLPEFQNLNFSRSDGSPLPNITMQTIVFVKK